MTPADRPRVEARREWAYGLIRRCSTPPPKYGSPEWLALPDGPEKVAAVVIAAESWAWDEDWLLENLAIEVEQLRRAHKHAEDAEWVARGKAHRENWTGERFKPDPLLAAEIEREWLDWAGGAA